MLTGDDLQHHYVANQIAELIGLDAIVVDVGRPINARQRLQQLSKRYNVRQLVSRTLLRVVAGAARDGKRRRREILNVLGPSAERFSDPTLVHHVHGLNTPEAHRLISSFSPDILVIFGTGIVGDTTLASARQLALNLHTGISPHYRGSDCVFWSIHNKDYNLVGSTVHECTADIDGGQIFARAVVDLMPDDGLFAIFAKCVEMGTDIYISVLRRATAGKLTGEAQNLTIGREYRATDKRLRHDLAVRWRFATAGVRRSITNGQGPIVHPDWDPTHTGDRNDGRDAPSVSVTIVNHSARGLLRECLGSLEKHPYTKGRMEVVVVDNASDDGSVEMLHTDFPSVVVVAESKRRGYGANQNLAVAASRGDFIFMLNPDAVVHEGTIDRLAAAMEWAPGVGAAGGPIANADGTIRQDAPHRFATPWQPLARALGLSRLGSSQLRGSVVTADGWPSGAACLVRRDVLDELGGFDESFFMYSEDADLFARMAQHRYLVSWVGDAVVSHPVPVEPALMSTRREAEKVTSELRYMRKHFGRKGATVHRLGIAVDALTHIVLLSIPGLNRVVRRHGRSPSNIRHSHVDRLRHALSGGAGRGLGELANDWNIRHHQPPLEPVEDGRSGRPPY
jgi:GT2 family glycosyltransferase/methionyl-tRNA formyltransferase